MPNIRRCTIAAGLLSLAACTGSLQTVPYREQTSLDGALPGVSYALPKVRYEVKISRLLAECPGDMVDGKPTALKFSVSAAATPTYLAGEAYTVNYDRLPGLFRTGSFELKLYPSGTLKSVGAAAEDRTAETISAVAKTALSMASAVSLSGGEEPARAALPEKIVTCKPETIKKVRDARQAETDLKTLASSLELLEKEAERFKAAGTARLTDQKGRERFLALLDDINAAERNIATLKKKQEEFAKELGVTDTVIWNGGVTAPEFERSYVLSDDQKIKLAELLDSGPPPAVYPKDKAEEKRQALFTKCYGADLSIKNCLGQQLNLKTGIYLDRDLRNCGEANAPKLECISQVAASDARVRNARDGVPDQGIFIREPMTGRLLICREVLLKEKLPCTVKEDEVKIAAADFPQFGQLRYLPLSVGAFQARELALSLTDTGRLESFTYKSTKAAGQVLAATVADVVSQYDAAQEKRETERRDDLKYARDNEIAEIQQRINLLTKEAELKKLQTPPEVDPLKATRDETAAIDAEIALLKAKLGHLKAQAEWATANP